MNLTINEVKEIIKENKALQLQTQRLLDISKRQQIRYTDAEKNINELNNKIKKIQKIIYDIAQASFSHNFSQEKIQDKPFDELIDFLVENINEADMKVFEIEKKEKENEELIEQYEKSEREKQEKIEELQKAIEDGEFVPVENEEDKNMPEIEQINPDECLKRFKNNDRELFDKLIKGLNNSELSAIKIIGEGETLFSNIAREMASSNNSTKKVLDSRLSGKGILKREVFSSMGKGRPASHYFLTELGEFILKDQFGMECVKTKKEELLTHGSANHGGFIANVGAILENEGYVVEYEKSFTLVNGKKVIPDIYTIDERDNDCCVMECERVKNPQDLGEKFDKYYQLFKEKQVPTNTVYFIVPEKSSDNNPLNLLQQELFRWIRDNKFGLKMLPPQEYTKASIIFKTTTFEEYKQKKEPRTFYYGFRPKFDNRGAK